MSYITADKKQRFKLLLDELRTEFSIDITDGELNYLITCLCLMYIEKNKKNYSVLNTVTGVLECAKTELYRRLISDYENGKVISNGDVYSEYMV